MAPDFLTKAWPLARDTADSELAPRAKDIEHVVLFGCGDSYHAALGVEMAFSAWTGRQARAVPSMTAARYLIPELKTWASNTLLVGVSASGEVARTIEALELGVKVKALTLALTGDPHSSLAQTAGMCLSAPTTDVPLGPGLISYLASLVMGMSVARTLAPAKVRKQIDRSVSELASKLQPWIEGEGERGRTYGQATAKLEPVVFVGSGPAYGSALFSAAKLIEAAGVPSWGQDTEEWSHVEYFANPQATPTWFLSAAGRSVSRELEVIEAAKTIGRMLMVSNWEGEPEWSPSLRESLSPLALWAGPVGFAAEMREQLRERAFRGFTGARSAHEGGGASRIRSSRRISDPSAWN